MAEIGRVPQRKQVTKLEMDYYATQTNIRKALLAVNVANYSELMAKSAKEKIDGMLNKLNRTAIKWTKESVPMAYKEGYSVARTRLEILGAARDVDFNVNIHKYSIEEYIDLIAKNLIKANMSIRTNVTMYFYLVRQAVQGVAQLQAFDFRDEQFISSLIDKAIREGRTRGFLQKLILEHLKIVSMEGQFIQINGRNYNMEKYADLVAKTRLREVQSRAVKNACAQFDNDLVEISSHGTDCVECMVYEGNVYSIGGKTKGYPYLEAWPPFHCRCQHHARPTSEVALRLRGAVFA